MNAQVVVTLAVYIGLLFCAGMCCTYCDKRYCLAVVGAFTFILAALIFVYFVTIGK